MNQLIFTVLTSFNQQFNDLDIGILRTISEGRNPYFDPFFIAVTNSAAAIAFGVPGIILIAGLIKRNKLMWHRALAVLIPVALSALMANILRYIFDTPRPFELYPFIEKLSTGGSPSFPSGHTADAFAFAVAALLVARNKIWAVPLLLWAALVATSRMWLGVHFPSDVLAGAVIGSLSAFYCMKWFRVNNWFSVTRKQDNA